MTDDVIVSILEEFVFEVMALGYQVEWSKSLEYAASVVGS
jgi:hypothetical protein